MYRTQTTSSGIAAALLLFLVVAAPLLAHGEGVLTADRTSMAAGQALRLEGSKLEAGSSYGLRLVGALHTYCLGEAKADSAGTFTLRLTVPDSVRPGTYRVEAMAPDGDVAAKVDLTVVAPAPASSASEAAPGRKQPMARAGDLAIARSRGGLGWGIIGLVIGLSAGLGVGLLLKGRPA